MSWNKWRGKWEAHAGHKGKKYVAGYFANVDDAAEAARLKRIELHTHNDLDRTA